MTTIVCMPAAAQDRCGLPAYSHNDYENRRPLLDAVGFGYSGVEVDYYLANGRLLVGHDAAGLTRVRSLAALYLVPLREMIRSQGPICAPGRQFLLAIETKQRRQAAFDSLMSVLSEYSDLVGPGGPVRVVLVGWTPPADSTLPFDLQYRVHSPDQIETMPTSPGIALEAYATRTSSAGAAGASRAPNSRRGPARWSAGRMDSPAGDSGSMTCPIIRPCIGNCWKPGSTCWA